MACLDLRGRSCLVVGGGTVATEKVAGLLDCGADVTVVAPEIDDELRATRPCSSSVASTRPTSTAASWSLRRRTIAT